MRFPAILGDPEPQPPTPTQLAQLRIAAARACRAWEEIDVDRLVRRERGYLVDAESDEVFRAYPGDAFSPGAMVVADQEPLTFYVASGDVFVLEKQPEMWSEILYRRERAGAR